MKNLSVNCVIALSAVALWATISMSLSINTTGNHASVAIRTKSSVFRNGFRLNFFLNLFKCKWKFKPSFHVIKNRLQNSNSNTCWDFISHSDLLERFGLLGALVVRNTRALKFSFRPKNFEVNEWLVGTIQNKLECV